MSAGTSTYPFPLLITLMLAVAIAYTKFLVNHSAGTAKIAPKKHRKYGKTAQFATAPNNTIQG